MIKIFFSYSHKDEMLRDELEIHLSVLKRQGVIETWHDRKIAAGQEFDHEISSYLNESHVILLLVSPYFLASDYCYDKEMIAALKMHKAGKASVIPIILHPCDWNSTPFGKLTACPRDGKPVSNYINQHDAFLEITKSIRKASEALSNIPEEKNEQLIKFDRNDAALKKEYEKIVSERDVELKSSLTTHREMSDWLNSNKDILIERIYKYIIDYHSNLELSYETPSTEKDILGFKLEISQFIDQLDVCLHEERTKIIDEPKYDIMFNKNIYKLSFSFLFERIPESISKESKATFKSDIEYLLTRI